MTACTLDRPKTGCFGAMSKLTWFDNVVGCSKGSFAQRRPVSSESKGTLVSSSWYVECLAFYFMQVSKLDTCTWSQPTTAIKSADGKASTLARSPFCWWPHENDGNLAGTSVALVDFSCWTRCVRAQVRRSFFTSPELPLSIIEVTRPSRRCYCFPVPSKSRQCSL